MSTQPQFLTSISHELKNQIAGILSLSEMIKEEFFGKFDDARHKREYIEAATDINNVANDMLEFVNDLMDIEQNQSGDFSIEMQEVDIVFLIKRVVKINQPYALTKNIKILFDDNQNSLSQFPKLLLDPRRTKQILTNLISNSVKYSQENTTITISVQIDNQNTKKQLTISIHDQGIGMTKQQIKMALEGEGVKIDKSALTKNHHYQTHNHNQANNHTSNPSHTQTQIDSHGIGMPLVKKLVELQNGEMSILSKVGSGTEITLNFPL